MITREEVFEAQRKWGKAIINIGTCCTECSSYQGYAEELINNIYAFDIGPVLFKPTKARDNQFRLDKEAAISYFISGNEKFSEDHGFALNEWVKIRFENVSMILEENRAFAMGNYFFIDKKDNECKVEYTFGYKKDKDGSLKIDIHHSSFPYCCGIENQFESQI